MLRSFSVAATLAALTTNSADAHGYISKPAAQFVDPTTSTYYARTINADINSAFGGLKWNDNPEVNTATFTSSFANAGYSSLRNMLDQYVSDCANTRTDVSPVDVSGLTTMNWQNDQEQKGFIESHHGPCEVWIDDTMVDHQDDCVAAYGSSYPASVKADFSKCSGDCMLRFFWLALHEPNWQIYKQCVPIVNNSGAQVTGTVIPADTTADIASDNGCQNRALRSVDDAPTQLASGDKIDWTDSRFLRAFNEFAASFTANTESIAETNH
ncbi:hypothetical protein PHYBOEH_011447 [Phytophthora boehmeriae]|uniref:Uncharacterized protein n=1 Tax=Phytophthora boehmeriae TaxID=109152 RepID=A0A8T1VJY7_9STRA|nr:hypothetical protein PHYBOEH_011447 [Phytophthora boehmeriae]